MGYDEQRESISRTPVTLAILTLDYCSNSFGTAPCTASGAACYNTFHSCKDRTNFAKTTRQYKFSSVDAPVALDSFRPYIKSVSYLPTEIKDKISATGRIKVELYDEPDTDIGIDPYVSTRPNVQGTYWGKLLARNPNYKGRTIAIYEGYLGDPFSEYRMRWTGPMERVTIKQGVVTLESIDILSGIGELEVPPKLDIKLSLALTSGATTIHLQDTDDVSSLPTSGYIRIDDEIIGYTAVDTSQNTLAGCTRAQFETIADSHNADVKVQLCRYYPAANPFDILKDMLLTDAKLPADQVDSAAFDSWRDWPGEEVDFETIVTEPTKLMALYREILDLIDCVSWVAEDLKVTIARRLPNDPARSYRTITDSGNMMRNSTSVDLNAEWRKVWAYLFWDKLVLGKDDEVSGYRRIDVSVDGEGKLEYGDDIEERILSRWVKYGLTTDEKLFGWIQDALARRMFSRRHAMPIISMSVEIKDSDIKTGSFVIMTTDELSNMDGTDKTARFMVIRRDSKGTKIDLKLQQLPEMVFGIIADDTAPDYADATDQERENCYICDEDGTVDGIRSYHIY